MSILWRSWMTFTAIIATVLVVLAVLSTLQHNALYSNLMRQRLSVVNLGLPISMVRNAPEVLARAQRTDPRITAIHAFNPSGIIVQTTGPDDPDTVPDEVRTAQFFAEDDEWSVESETELFSGASILNGAGSTAGNIVVVYPKSQFEAQAPADDGAGGGETRLPP